MSDIHDTVEGRRTRARALVNPRVRALENARIPFVRVSDDHCRVADKYDLFLSAGFWRTDDARIMGYCVGSLIAEYRIGEAMRNFTPPPECPPHHPVMAPSVAPSADPENEDLTIEDLAGGRYLRLSPVYGDHEAPAIEPVVPEAPLSTSPDTAAESSRPATADLLPVVTP